MNDHQQRLIDQFTKQAACFADAPGIKDETALQLVIDFAGISGDDDVLDVACGSGILTCACAKVSRHATGIDITPTMIERAKDLQAREGLENLKWHVGDVRSLPFGDDSFSVLTSRYAFHHLPEPVEVLHEMKRVCQPGGRIVLIDMAAPPALEQAIALNRMERLRDPSHVLALSSSELTELFSKVGLAMPEQISYRLEFALDTVLDASFPVNGEKDKTAIRAIFQDSLSNDSMGLQPRMNNGQLWYSYPIVVLKSAKET
jgi:ubiquinone/menaquinone biosynthesis C-methylase UbiE